MLYVSRLENWVGFGKRRQNKGRSLRKNGIMWGKRRNIRTARHKTNRTLRSQAGPKGRQLEVGAQGAPRLPVYNICVSILNLYINICTHFIGTAYLRRSQSCSIWDKSFAKSPAGKYLEVFQPESNLSIRQFVRTAGFVLKRDFQEGLTVAEQYAEAQVAICST